MFIFIILMNLILSVIMMFVTHPLSMGGLLLSQTILISLLMGNMNMNFWYSYILFLVMVGGMLVLFIYMTSIASNEKFSFNYWLIFIFTLCLLSIPLQYLKMNFSDIFNNKEFQLFELNLNFQQLMNKFMNWPSVSVMMFMIIYLLLCLIAIVKITNLSYGPLRPNN